jgi:hypothetical protein
MNQLVQILLAQVGEKGADKKRNASLLVLLFVAWQILGIDKRLSVVESRLGIMAEAVQSPHGSTNAATTGPSWPKGVAAAFLPEK